MLKTTYAMEVLGIICFHINANATKIPIHDVRIHKLVI